MSTASDILVRWQRRGLAVGLVGGIGCVLVGLSDIEAFFRGWLYGFMCWLAFPLGSLAILMTHHLTGGRWGLALRPMLYAMANTLLLFVPLFLPIAFGVEWLYPWANADIVAHDAVLQHKSVYLNVPFFMARAGIYFALWIGVALVLQRNVQAGSARPVRDFSAIGLLLTGLAITFAAIDWIMSLDPHWYSTIFGMLIASAQVLPAFALAVLALILVTRHVPFSDLVTPNIWNDLGNLMLALVMMWAYIGFSQYFLIWAGNLPEEITWYVARSLGIWEVIAWALIAFYFFVPFMLLLSRDLKRDPGRLAMVAGGILIMHVVYQYWLIRPAFQPIHASTEGVSIATVNGLDFVPLLAIGGVWLAVFCMRLQKMLTLWEHELPGENHGAHGPSTG